MRRSVQTHTTTGAKAWIPCDFNDANGGISFAAALSGGTGTFSIEVTYDDLYDATVTPVAFPTSVAAATASAATGSALPISGVRVNISAIAGATVKFTVLQGGLV